ncbi:hypothetical protein PINS_up001785 [Pythium insidiosum]|nr:hypothetical protein PINS_up001785 [Pythium insidiosum]
MTETDDGIRVRGAPLASPDDVAFPSLADESSLFSLCRPASHRAKHGNKGQSDGDASSTPLQYTCHCEPSAAEAREFRKRWMFLTDAERTTSLRANTAQFLQTVAELLPCLGCRSGTESLFHDLLTGTCGSPPSLVVHSGLCFERDQRHFRLNDSCMSNPDATLALFLHHERYASAMLTKQTRSAKGASSSRARCQLHSQRSRGRPRPAAFEALWNKLTTSQQRQLSHIDSDQFLTDLENYLRRHRFCCRCKEKVLEAYDLLIGSSCSEDDCEDCAGFDCADKHHDRGEYGDELHYTSYLFDELTYSRATGHIVVPCHIDFLSQLMSRADQEIF